MMDNRVSIRGILVWLVCSSFFMYEFLLRTVLGTFQNQLMQDLNLTIVQFSLLSSTVFQVIYALMQIPLGIIIDRLGIKKTLLTAVLICSFGSLCFALTHHFVLACLFRIMMGLGASCGFICVLITVYDWMPRKNIALFIGISQFIGTMGPMLSAGPMHTLSNASSVGWRSVFVCFFAVGLVIALLVLLYVDKNRQSGDKFIILSRPTNIMMNIRRLIAQKQIWAIALFSACVYFSVEYLTENEGLYFLVHKGFSEQYASYMLTLAWLGYAIACPTLGFLSDKIQRRRPFMYFCAWISLVGMLLLIYFPVNSFLAAGCFLALGIGAAGSSIGFAVIAEQCSEAMLGVGLGLNNMMMVLASGVHAPIIGFLLTRLSAGSQPQLGQYQEAFFYLIALLVVAIVSIVWGVKETFCKSTCENTILTVATKEAIS